MFTRPLITTLARLGLPCLVLAACLVESTDEPASICPLTGPVRLSAMPESWDPLFPPPEITGIDDGQIRYTFETFPGETGIQQQIDACGGEPELVLAGYEPHLAEIGSLDTSRGEVTYYEDKLAGAIVIDRADLSEPRAVTGLPADAWPVTRWPDLVVFRHHQRVSVTRGAAGLGGVTEALYGHDGDPDHPAELLVDDVVSLDRTELGFIVLRDDGELMRLDPLSGASTTLLTGVRAYFLHGSHLIWQAIGDDIAEPMYLRDLDSGNELSLGINEFCPQSWSRDPSGIYLDIGEWWFDDDGQVAAFRGPEYTLAAMHRVDTGAAIEVPAHETWLQWDGVAHFSVREPDDTVSRLLWDPVSDARHTWFRGPGDAWPVMLGHDDHGVEYIDVEVPNHGIGSMWRFDFASGERTLLLPRMRQWYRTLADGRYLVEFPTSDEPFRGPVDLVLIDPETATYTTLAEQVFSPRPFLGDGVDAYAYFDVLGPQPGLWVTPIPPP